MHSALENVREFSLGPEDLRSHPERAFKIDSPQPGMVEAIRFNFDELSFLLDESGDGVAPVLMELMTLEWQYTVFVRSVELRAEAVAELHKAIQARPLANLDFQGIQMIFGEPLAKATAITDQLIASVDDGIQSCKDQYERMVAAAIKVFPGQEILEVHFQRGGDRQATPKNRVQGAAASAPAQPR